MENRAILNTTRHDTTRHDTTRHDTTCLRFEGTVTGGFCWEELTRRRWEDPKCLERYGYKVYSQNDEDGIIQEIFKRIGTTDKRFIEFGVQDGLESNTHYLLHKGWSGLWIEGSSEYVRELQGRFRPVIKSGQLKAKNAFITRDNINELFTSEGFTGEIDLLSIDIDGNEYCGGAFISANETITLPHIMTL